MHILLHLCCGPCAIMPVLRLRQQGHKVTGFFANPNIHPLSEYLKRREAMLQCALKLDLAMIWCDEVWNIENWTRIASEIHSTDQNRCAYCYASRFDICASYAKELDCDAFCSSLLYSRYQNHSLIQSQAHIAASKYQVEFYYDDFRDSWQQGIDLAKEFELYRQNYCGCIYSEAERHMKKLTRLIKN